MGYKTKEGVMDRVMDHHLIAQELGHEVVGTFLQGSWNYGDGVSDEESDVDTKCLVIPSFNDFCLNKKPVSYTHITDNDEHIDIKDLRLYVECFKKQNVNFVEILFTEYFVINPKYASAFNKLLENRERIGHYNNYATLNCIAGMAMEKNKALCHPYPSIADKIEKYGYDGKQISHIYRLEEFMNKWIAEVSYEECLKSDIGNFIKKVKRNQELTLEEAVQKSQELSDRIYATKTKYMKENELRVDHELDEIFNQVIVEIMKKHFKEEVNS
ncbi:hypothetical protein M2140_000034 [Clostridiales Family XIII bacterium PM5-7]